MASSSRSSLRPTPPLSPSKRLLGLEQVVPPPSPLSSRSKTSLPPNTNKPLPSKPRRSSSVYSNDSGYTEIIDAYAGNRPPSPDIKDEMQPKVVLQPTAYRETISDLLKRRLGEPKSPSSIPSFPSLPSNERRSAASTPTWPPEPSLVSHSVGSDNGEDNLAPDEIPPILTSQTTPGISPLPITLPTVSHHHFEDGTGQSVPRRSRPAKLQQSPEFRAISYERTENYLPEPLSPRITDVVDQSLMPQPLIIPKVNADERPASRFSRTSSSESSLIFYHGIRESIRGYLYQRRKKRKAVARKKEHARIMSTASAKYPYMKSNLDENNGNPPSRRMSLQQGLANIYDRIRKFSLSGSSEASIEIKDPRRRAKQRAIPLSPYQKYGPIIWDSPQRREKIKQKLREERQRARLEEKTGKQGEIAKGKALEHQNERHHAPPPLVSSFRTGQKQIVSALGDRAPKVKRTSSEKRREALKKSIKMIGPADQFPDGRVNYWI